jgi:hypothetical protein
MNELELPRIGPFGVDNWTQVPPFSFTGDVERGILSLAEVNDLLEERSGGPSTEELFDPAIRHSALPICNTDDWQYAVRSPVSAVDLPLMEVPVELAGEERLAVVRFLVARIHHVYGAHEEALVAYEELATLSCVRDEDERIAPNLLPFCRSAALHASRLLGPAD